MEKKSIKEITNEFKSSPPEGYPALAEKYSIDERQQVRKLVMSYGLKYDDYLYETKRILNMRLIEQSLYKEGYKLIAGTDEVGRGPLCGPVVSACVIMPLDSNILYINDSKKLSAKKREELNDKILSEATAIGIGIVDNKTIDEINILNATKLSMEIALKKLNPSADFLLLDALTINTDIPQRGYVKGDANIYPIAAASIVAKVARDSLMDDYDEIYPGYGLKSNKGYGSQKHIDAIRDLGVTPIHRMSFLNGILNDTHRKVGFDNEERALNYLKNKSFKLLEKNYSRAGGEIDLIMKDKDTIVFCEVKSAKFIESDSPATRIDSEKKKRIFNTAYKYLAENGLLEALVRYDVVAIELFSNGTYRIKHYKNAFSD